ncbi:MAG: hypothetical protein IKU61_07230 [Clostridia bacterium]|nr:hypothetical protein [Clostridia bacterium]
MRDVEKRMIIKPALAAFPEDDGRMTDNEYLRLAVAIMARCKIKMNREERDESVKIDFYFEETAIEGRYVDDIMHLMRASDMYTLSVMKSYPQTIRLSCYRTIHE